MSQIIRLQNRVHSSPSSLFTKEDVLNLLEELETLQIAEAETAAKAAAEQAQTPAEHVGFYSPKQVRDLVLSISEAVEDRLLNYDFSDDVELELNYKEIEATVEPARVIREVIERIVETANEELDLKMA